MLTNMPLAPRTLSNKRAIKNILHNELHRLDGYYGLQPGASCQGAAMKQQVVLVSLDWRRPQDSKTGLGIASIAASLHVATES